MGLKPVSTINITIDGGGSQVVEETLNTFNTQNKTYEISELVKDGNVDFTLPVTVSVGEKENVVKDTTVRWGENITIDPSVRIREADGSLSSWKSITGSETTINSSISAKGSIGSLVPGNNYNQGYYTGGTVETTNVTINEVDGSTTNVGSVSGNSDRVNSSLPQRGSIGNLMPGDYDYDGYYSSGRVGKTTVRINEVDGSTTYHGNVSGYSDRVNSSLPQRGSIGSLMPGEYGFDGYYDSGRVGETTVRINEVDGTTTYAGDVSGSSDRVNSEIPQRGSLNSVTPGSYESGGYYDGGTIPKAGSDGLKVHKNGVRERKNKSGYVFFDNDVEEVIMAVHPAATTESYDNDGFIENMNIGFADWTEIGHAFEMRTFQNENGYWDYDPDARHEHRDKPGRNLHVYLIDDNTYSYDFTVKPYTFAPYGSGYGHLTSVHVPLKKA